MTTPEPDQLLTCEEAANFMAVSKRTIWRMVAAGTIPQPIRLNRKVVRWRASDLVKHFASIEEQQRHALANRLFANMRSR